MKWQLIGLLGAALLVSGCRHRQKPPQTTRAPVQVSRVTVPSGFIAQCDHPGARRVAIAYPRGWQARLARESPSQAAIDPDDELLGGVTLPPKAVEDKNAQPIRPPAPNYPQAGLDRRLEAECSALFDVTVDGKPVDMLVGCTSPEFVSEARRAIGTITFAPRSEGGQRVVRRNVVYPIQFCMRGNAQG